MQTPIRPFVLAISFAAMLFAVPTTTSGHEFDTKSAWLPEVEELYRPDVHHSQAAATQALARDLAEKMKAAGDGVLNVRCADDGLRVQVVHALDQAGLKHGGGLTLVAHVEAGESLEQAVNFRVVDRGIEMKASFVTKPWVHENPQAGFTVVRGLAAGDLVGKSRDAIAQAIDSEILPRIRKKIGEHHRPSNRWANEIARRRVKQLLEDSPIVVDRFRQTFYKSIDGDEHVVLVREAVLLDLSEENLQEIVQPIVRDLQRARHRWSVAIGFAATAVTTVLFVCCLGYTFFNRLTQGYYVWSIRFATVALFAVSVTLAAKIALSIIKSM